MPIEKEKVSFTYDLSELLSEVPEDDREDAAYDAGEAALQKVHEYMGKVNSPVKGGIWTKTLKSKEYQAYKQKKVGNKKANLLLNGDLINSMSVDATDTSFTINVDEDNAGKAHNHNTATTVPYRQFLPDDTKSDSTFKKPVIDAIKKAIARYKKPVQERPTEAVAPVEVTTEAYKNLYATFQATKREQQIAKNLSLFKIEDIL